MHFLNFVSYVQYVICEETEVRMIDSILIMIGSGIVAVKLFHTTVRTVASDEHPLEILLESASEGRMAKLIATTRQPHRLESLLYTSPILVASSVASYLSRCPHCSNNYHY